MNDQIDNSKNNLPKEQPFNTQLLFQIRRINVNSKNHTIDPETRLILTSEELTMENSAEEDNGIRLQKILANLKSAKNPTLSLLKDIVAILEKDENKSEQTNLQVDFGSSDPVSKLKILHKEVSTDKEVELLISFVIGKVDNLQKEHLFVLKEILKDSSTTYQQMVNKSELTVNYLQQSGGRMLCALLRQKFNNVRINKDNLKQVVIELYNQSL